MTEIYGEENYVKDSDCELIHKDEWGELFRKECPGDEELRFVRCKNSTPELDGTYRTEYVFVPPSMTRAKEALAWSFGMTEEEYDPHIQT